MKKFYISPKEDFSTIGKYSRNFYHLILKEKGYIHIDSEDSLINILSTISSKDHTHIELDINQKKEIEILFTMLKANYRNVAVTLHHAPFIKHPFYEFKNPLLNNISKFLNKHTNIFGAANAYAKKLKAIYVLSKNDVETVKKKYKVENVYFLPILNDKPKLQAMKNETHNYSFLNHSAKEVINTIID